ncbi:two-component system response regulator DesR [Streptomyces griseochromogenes]|uniref:DNA-binding response regulator n=1 Tax=Streptomyces griseochromogenes TaxID=68214 RepID=A0A1B1BB89_9ACTN|nr:response regulator transcription factor [Streptomyces griseochromogenes]ANP55992.1 DNA-binding response regulator [Streptomyces griseochromogenes]MBP2051159.1 two-component system response regulator DesR [Streptomyces griseochromogenes]
MIRVLLAEDQGMMLGAIAQLLDLETDIEVVAQVGTGAEVVDAARASDPHIAVLDIEMPVRTGLEAAEDLRRLVPGCRVLIVTTFAGPGYCRRALDAGARGFLAKDGPVAELAHAIRRVHAGEQVVDPLLAAAALSAGSSPLTTREREVLAAAADGAPVMALAKRLHLSESTIRNHLSSATQKIGVRNRMEAVNKAKQNGWL